MSCCTFTGSERSHRFVSLNQLTGELQTHYNQLLTSAGDKLADIPKQDKQLWKILQDEEAQINKKLKVIEEIRDDQV